MLSIILIVSFFALLAFNVPVMVSLGLSSVVALFVGGFSFDAISSTMSASISKFVLLAIPFFILAGNAMEKVGISEYLLLCDIVPALPFVEFICRMRSGIAEKFDK